MLKNIIILLDDRVPSFCTYETKSRNTGLISTDRLKQGVVFAMKNNLSVQFVYPDAELPEEYKEIIDTIDHVNIKSLRACDEEAHVVVVDGWNNWIAQEKLSADKVYVLRISKDDLFSNETAILNLFHYGARINIVLTDIEDFKEDDFRKYERTLSAMTDKFEELYAKCIYAQTNLLTDRLLIDSMNNCNAGCETITLAPDGHFYICPAFYFAGDCDGSEQYQHEICEKGYNVGSLEEGLDIKNPQLYRLDHAPLCRHCDAYQCKRCVWLNRKTTLEVNTPGHEQCVVSHLERNASRMLCERLRKYIKAFEDVSIDEIDYTDPYDIRDRWKQ